MEYFTLKNITQVDILKFFEKNKQKKNFHLRSWNLKL